MKNKPPIIHLHPLDPLTAQEIEYCAGLVKDQLDGEPLFSSVALVEPSKAEINGLDSDQPISRKLKFVGLDYQTPADGGFEATVDLETDEVQIKRIAQGHAPIGASDAIFAISITKQDAGWLEAVRKRGITDIDLVQIDPWPAGGYQHPSIPAGHRANRTISFVREDQTDNNGYARPISGLIAHVDLTEGRVTHLEDHGEIPLPIESGRYDEAHQENLQPPLSSLAITQPQGPGFEVNGHAVKWRGWEFRVGMHPVHGLVLHQLGIRDNGELRPILHRAALSDMVVPYGDPNPMHRWKHVLDASEANLGSCVNSLKLGCDCLGDIHYLDHVLVNPNGTARVVENAICIHEEDYGVLWKHGDWLTKSSEVRRSRRLVISIFCTVGNYDYGFYWYLYLDGTIQMEVKLTGIVAVTGITEGNEDAAHAPLIAPNLVSPIHQHLFCFRLDFNLDGEQNRIYEVNTTAAPVSESNPDGTVFGAQEKLLKREQDAISDVNAQTGRYWKIVNPNRKNRMGKSVAYRLVPESTPTLYSRNDSKVAQRAGFAKHNFWATPYAQDELCAAGDYTNLHPGGDGLPRWTEKNRALVDTDIVVWHTVGSTHIPRPEDWPVMPVEYCGFKLQPVGFFERNPGINLASEKSHEECHQ